MDLKPIITNFGDEKLYTTLSKEIERRLPGRTVEWKRSFGRTIKTVCLKASFTKFNSDLLKGSSDGNVNKQPFLHICWTSCQENDEYRGKIKPQITNWQQRLKDDEISDWLIVQVVSQDYDKTKRTKLSLPRSSVFDKIKNDFCGRIQGRCVQLWEPTQETRFSKSEESWQSLLNQLRQLLLESMSKHLTKFEEKVRSLREMYEDNNWSFIEYFKLNEELATIFKSVTLHEDALVQYDELDALFSQFVVNSQVKGASPWLQQYMKTCTSWDGISLNKQVIKDYRELVHQGKASLFQLRNYLFIRQWQIIVKLKRNWEIIPRLLDFLFTVVRELVILKVQIPEGAVACWVVTSCLEFLLVTEKKEEFDRPTKAYVGQICDYARQKLKLLGEICYLLPDSRLCTDLSQKQAQCLINGLCTYQTKPRDNDSSSVALSEALSSQFAFEKLYLNISERTQNAFTEIGRHRFAMNVEIDLARHCLSKGDYDTAEPKLEKALSVFDKQRWSVLHTDVLVPLAECQAKHGAFDRYLSSLPLLACATILSEDKRTYYTKELLKLAYDEHLMSHTINSEPILKIEDVTIDLLKEIGQIGEEVSVTLCLKNNLPIPLFCDDIVLGLRYSNMDQAKCDQGDYASISPRLKMDFPKMVDVLQDPEERSADMSADRKPGLLNRIRSKRLSRPSLKSENTPNSTERTKQMSTLLEVAPSSSTESLLSEDLGNDDKDGIEDTAVEDTLDLSTAILIPEPDYDEALEPPTPIWIPERDYDYEVEHFTPTEIPERDYDKNLQTDHDKLEENVTAKNQDDIVFDCVKQNKNILLNHTGLTLLQQSEGLTRTDSCGSSLSNVSMDTVWLERCDSTGEKRCDSTGEKEENIVSNQEQKGIEGPFVSIKDIKLKLFSSVTKSHSEDCDLQENSIANSENPSICLSEEVVDALVPGNNTEYCKSAVPEPLNGSSATPINDLISANNCTYANAKNSEQSESDPNELHTSFLTCNDKICSAHIDSEEPTVELSDDSSDDMEEDGTVSPIIKEPLMIEPEDDIPPVQRLSSGKSILQPGLNTTKVSAKVYHEGRYALQSFSCKFGRVTLYRLLGLKRKSRAFFIVADPPKFYCTQTRLVESLLVGSKQRIYISMENGPGYICSSSVIHLTSSTGLHFHPISPSSIMVYPHNQKDPPKEGAMHIEVFSCKENASNTANIYIPSVSPYEKIDLFFDVTAPVKRTGNDSPKVKHMMTVECLWLSDLICARTQLDSIFYEPFKIEEKLLFCGERRYVHILLRNLNPVQIMICSPSLTCLNLGSHVIFQLTVTDIEMRLCRDEEFSLVWELDEKVKDLTGSKLLQCLFKVNFRTEDRDDFDQGEFSKELEINNTKTLLEVNCSIKEAEINGMLLKGSQYSFNIEIKPVHLNNSVLSVTDQSNFKILIVLEDDEHWKFDDEMKDREMEIDLKEGTTETMNTPVIPCNIGRTDLPHVKIFRVFEKNTHASREQSDSPREQSDSPTLHQNDDHVSTDRKGARNQSKLIQLLSNRRTSTTCDDQLRKFEDGEIVFSSRGMMIYVNDDMSE